MSSKHGGSSGTAIHKSISGRLCSQKLLASQTRHVDAKAQLQIRCSGDGMGPESTQESALRLYMAQPIDTPASLAHADVLLACILQSSQPATAFSNVVAAILGQVRNPFRSRSFPNQTPLTDWWKIRMKHRLFLPNHIILRTGIRACLCRESTCV